MGMAGEEAEHEEADHCGDQRGEESDAELGIAPEGGAEPLGVGDHGRFAVVREAEMF